MLLSFSATGKATGIIDNSSLLEYTASESKLVKSYFNGVIETPEWVSSLIMVEIRPDTASMGGTFGECYDLIDYYAQVGVNGIWLTPVYEKSEIGNGKYHNSLLRLQPFPLPQF